ncbi:hypothetical protein Y032_1484g3892, partial [Ancylostoma ceylanicum]
QHVDAWESVTVKKKVNRRGRKRKAGPAYKKDPDELEDDPVPTDETALKLKRLLGDSFDPENVLRVNSLFYTAVNSKDESEETSTPYNLHAEFHSFVDESLPETGTKLADDISRRFSRNCRLAGGKALSKKHSPSHRGLFSEVLMCGRCHCLCLGVKTMQSHLSRCCPELQSDEDKYVPYDLENGLLVRF